MDKDEKSANSRVKKRKLSPNMEPEPLSLRSSKTRLDETEQSSISKINSNGGEKEAKIDNGKGEKRKLFIVEDGSEKPSKRRLHGDNTDHSDEAVAKESGELPTFSLPSELLVKIIDMVPVSQWASLESVSHQFQDVVHGLWGQQREIRLDELVYKKEKPYQVVKAVLSKFLIRASNVASISGFAEVFDRSTPIRLEITRLLSRFEHLKMIDFSGREMMTAKTFASFLGSSASRHCLKSLDIADGVYGTMKSHQAFGSKKNQPALNLECFKFNAECLHIFDRFLPIEWSRLEKLVIMGRYNSLNELFSIIGHCTQLAHLEIMVPDCGNGNGQPSYGQFMQTVAALENLSVLKFTYYWDCNCFRAALLGLIEDLGRRNRIVDLALVGRGVRDQILGAIIDHLPRLTSLELDVGACTKTSLERLANRMGQLETLKLRWCGCLVDSSVVRAIVGNMGGLRCLHLDCLDVNLGLKSLGDLRNLTELHITESRIQTGDVETWAHHGFGSRLVALKLPDITGVSTEVVDGLFKNMPRLRSLKLLKVTDGILEIVGESCPNLVDLELRRSPTITSVAVQSIIDRCSQLEFLKVCDHSGSGGWFPAALTVKKYRNITFKSF